MGAASIGVEALAVQNAAPAPTRPLEPPTARRTVAIVGNPTRTSALLVRCWQEHGVDAVVLDPDSAAAILEPGDVVLVRLDVLPTLDAIEPGLDRVRELGRRGVRVLNRPEALLAMHDKLLTLERLAAAGVPQPAGVHVVPGEPLPSVPLPGVLKPRFGSWGTDVFRYETLEQLGEVLREVADRPWWRRHGALAQELIAGVRADRRVLVAGGRAVGGATRIARPGEWRTNVSLGARLVHAEVPADAARVACAAVAAVGADLAGVDLLPSAAGWVVLEVNGAADFDERYASPGGDVCLDVAVALGLPCSARPSTREEPTMPKTMHGEPVKQGDVIEITGHTVGDAPRTAEVLEVLGGAGHEHFRVRWEDGHESIFFPGEDARVVRPKARRPAKR